MRTRTAQGFTLIELMVVVTIIGILASISMPSYQDYIVRSQVVDGLGLIDGFKRNIKEFYKARGRFPADNLEAGMPEPDKLISNYVKKITLEDGAFHIEFGHKVNLRLKNRILTIRPVVVTESPASPFSWLCGNDTVVPGMDAIGQNRTSIEPTLLPISCRAWQGELNEVSDALESVAEGEVTNNG